MAEAERDSGRRIARAWHKCCVGCGCGPAAAGGQCDFSVPVEELIASGALRFRWVTSQMTHFSQRIICAVADLLQKCGFSATLTGDLTISCHY
jgi:hypothetical protein